MDLQNVLTNTGKSIPVLNIYDMKQVLHIIIIYAALLTLTGCGEGNFVRKECPVTNRINKTLSILTKIIAFNARIWYMAQMRA